jgi:peptidoglycan/xylan/chitin deacetylase (PgdA/CDA1 family)
MIDRVMAKRLMEGVLVGSGACRVGIRSVTGRTLVLAYHNVVPVGQEVAVGERALHLPQAEFAAQLDRLLATHEVIPLERLRAGEGNARPRLVITFDDAYRGAVTAGVAELKARGLPATIFVSPGLVGAASFWWDAIAHEGEVAFEHRSHAIRSLAGDDARVREWARRTEVDLHPVPSYAQPANEAEVEEAGRTPGITLGSHGWSHRALPYLSEQGLRDELIRPLQWLRERFGRTIPWISYPYGESSRAVEGATQEAGYVGGLRISGGWLDTQLREPFAAPRMNIPAGLSIKGFQLRTAGVIPG